MTLATTPSPAVAVPQWQVRVSLQQWINDYAVDVERVDGPTSWFITAEEAEEALDSGEALDEALDRDDARVPEAVRDHNGPFYIELVCTGCATVFDYRKAGPGVFARHSLCAPDAPDAPGRQPLTWPHAWRTALASETLLNAAERSARTSEPVAPPGDAEPYTIELRFDVTAGSPGHARRIADLLAAAAGGRVSAVFNSGWDEV